MNELLDPKSGARWQIGVVVDFQCFLDVHIGENSSDRRVFDFGDLLDEFDLRIDDAVPVREKWRKPTHADVGVFVDRGADDRAAMLAEPRRIVGSATEERNSEWRTTDDHAR